MPKDFPARCGDLYGPGRGPSRVLVLATFDSFLKAALPLARFLERKGCRVEYRLIRVRSGQISARQRAAIGFSGPLAAASMSEVLAEPGFFDIDVVLLALDGRRTSALLAAMRARAPATRRPLTVAFYPGVVFRYHMHGLVNRFGADLILFNSPADQLLYRRTAAALGCGDGRGLCLGSTVLSPPATPRPAPVWPPASVVYAEQPDVPASRIERLYIIDRLIEYARLYPDRRVLIKPRLAPGETTLRRTTYHLAHLMAEADRLGGVPANLAITYAPIEELLDEADLCLTVSSTVALQAAARGIPFAAIGDFGVCEDYGTHFFVESGCLTDFDRILADARPSLDPRWRARHVLPAAANLEHLWTAIVQRLAAQEHGGRALAWPADPFAAMSESYRRYRDGCATARFVLRPSHRGSGATARKLRKLVRDPRSFFADMLANFADRFRRTPRPRRG